MYVHSFDCFLSIAAKENVQMEKKSKERHAIAVQDLLIIIHDDIQEAMLFWSGIMKAFLDSNFSVPCFLLFFTKTRFDNLTLS